MVSLEAARAKQELRESMRAARAAIAPSDRAILAARAEARLLTLPEVRDARCVLLFYSFGSEIPTSVLIRRLLQRGRRVLLPYLTGDAMEAAEFRWGDELHPSDYGPREPSRRVPVDPQMVDVVVTPGLAFDRAGHRLGYGGGFYDRYLTRLHPAAARVAIAFASQVVDAIPSEPTDEPVDVIVTDTGVIRVERSGV